MEQSYCSGVAGDVSVGEAIPSFWGRPLIRAGYLLFIRPISPQIHCPLNKPLFNYVSLTQVRKVPQLWRFLSNVKP